MRVQSALEANSQLPKARKPGMRALHHQRCRPSRSLLSTLDGQFLPEFPSSQVCPAAAIVITLVRMKLIRLLPGPAGQARDGGKRINQRFEGNRVMTVGPGNAQRQWRATTIYDDVPLAAVFPGRWGCGLFLGLPVGWLRWRRQCWPGSSQFDRVGAAWSAKPDANDPRRPAPASPGVFASRSSRCQSPVLLAVFPRNAGGENEQNAIERSKIIDPWSPALYRTSGWHKQ